MKMQFSIIFALLTLSLSSVFAQNTAITYQGHINSGGTNFTGAGQFKFALVTSSNANHTATATANAPSGGYITGYNVTFGGNGYVTAPAVTVFGGGGSGATAHANVSGGSVVSVSVDSTGNGQYASAPAVLIAPPPANLSYITYWSNDGTSVNGSEPSGAVLINVSNGLFSVALGDTTQPFMTAIPPSLFTQPNLQLRIWFNDGTHGFAALDPVQNLTPTPYANFAAAANSANSVPSSALVGTYSNPLTLNNVANSISGNGTGLTSLNASQLSSGQVSATVLNNAWKVSGNTGANPTNGAFLGANDMPLELRANGARVLRLECLTNGSPNVIGGSAGNSVSPGVYGATIAGGGGTSIPGYSNADNRVTGVYGTIGGGIEHNASFASFIGGGISNYAGGYSVIGGGYQNSASGDSCVIGGGTYNVASGSFCTVPGGANNVATGLYSFAAGFAAQAVHDGSFVWADESRGAPFASTAANQFSVYAIGGIRLAGDVSLSGGRPYHNLSLSGGNSSGYIYGSYPALGDGIHLGYNYYYDYAGGGHVANSGGATSRITAGYGFVDVVVGPVGGAPNFTSMHCDNTGITGVIHNTSDRNVKHGFTPVDPSSVLEKLSSLPLSEWSYDNDPKTRHIGPMAQDFHAAFNVGIDDKHITSIDEAGVAFAAIQALNEKLRNELKVRDAENAELKARLEKLEQLVSKKITQ